MTDGTGCHELQTPEDCARMQARGDTGDGGGAAAAGVILLLIAVALFMRAWRSLG